MTFAKSERADLCDLLDSVGPDAATLCTGWSTGDLAAHLWIRENDPVGVSGMLAKPLAGLTERRMNEIRERWPYPELVDRIRRGPARFSVFAIPGVDEPANTTEFFIHHEDVRRAGPTPMPARELEPGVEDWMWRRLKLLGRAFFRRSPVGVTLERTVDPVRPIGPVDPLQASTPPVDAETLRAMGGPQIVTLIGRPSELMVFAHGRTTVADVKLVGESAAIDQLNEADLRL